MIVSVLKKSFFFHFFLDIYLQQWRKSTSSLSFRENKGIILYNFTRKTKVSCYKRSREKSSQRIIEFNSVYNKHVLKLTMIVDFFRFWINIDIKTNKTLWKVTLKKERHMKNCINIIRRQKMANRCSRFIISSWIYSLVKNKGVKIPIVTKHKNISLHLHTRTKQLSHPLIL